MPLSLRDLARTLGIRPQSLAHCFPTKSALLDALFRDGFPELGERLSEPSDEPPTGLSLPADPGGPVGQVVEPLFRDTAGSASSPGS